MNDGEGEGEGEKGESVDGGVELVFDEGAHGQRGEQGHETANVGGGGLRPKGGGDAEYEGGEEAGQIREEWGVRSGASEALDDEGDEGEGDG